jgi:hypothetical protein
MTFGMMIVNVVSGLSRGGLLDIRSWNLDKNLHFTWVDGKTNVDVNFYHKGQDKSQVVAQLSSLNESKKMNSLGKRSLNC